MREALASAVQPATAFCCWFVFMLASGPWLATKPVIVTIETVGVRASDGEVRRGNIGTVEVGCADRDAEGGVGRVTGGLPFP